MMLTDEEIARLQAVAPFLRSEAAEALKSSGRHEVTLELEAHLQPGLRIRAPQTAQTPRSARDRDAAPPYPLDLFVGLPLNELRALANGGDAARERGVAHFGATFLPRLVSAIQTMTPDEIDLTAGVQSKPGTLSVMLDDEQ
ncbi:hypothetical protein ACTJLC_24740 [Paraburkholderia sp. 22099]|jgi:hypothetical protein|uniref:hypothetical protein n=1 Tax=Paraburkholderia TaxID=1822464 RepID=UPI00285769B1|nr:hypothetical protein [Paraburkholderia terricola]MDR6448764.1 hypothetical protein [Paraburkholderia terricola]MDR6494976.1 hypothetical protein [Paraburkholderia terricola]